MSSPPQATHMISTPRRFTGITVVSGGETGGGGTCALASDQFALHILTYTNHCNTTTTTNNGMFTSATDKQANGVSAPFVKLYATFKTYFYTSRRTIYRIRTKIIKSETTPSKATLDITHDGALQTQTEDQPKVSASHTWRMLPFLLVLAWSYV